MCYFERPQDRAGRHHTLEMGLTMLDRARWTGKFEEAEVDSPWIVNKLSKPLIGNIKSLEEKRLEKTQKNERCELKPAA